MKTMWKLWSGVFVCVVLPITTYVIDIIIAVNVVEQKVYKEKLSYYHDFTNKDNLPIPKTETILGYTYNLTDTFLGDVSKLKKNQKISATQISNKCRNLQFNKFLKIKI